MSGKNTQLNIDLYGFNSFLSHLEKDDKRVIWIRDLEYKKQLYISPSYEKVWRRSCQSLIEYPESWNGTLLTDNVTQFMSLIKSRRPEQHENNVLLFKIFDITGRVCYIKDSIFYLFNQRGEAVAVVGISDEISEQQWLQEAKAGDNLYPTDVSFTSNLFLLLNDKLNLSNKKTEIPFADKSSTQKRLNLELKNREGHNIVLTPREYECLLHLCQGKSAKTISRDLNISPRTVEVHINNIKIKMRCRSSVQLIAFINALHTHST